MTELEENYGFLLREEESLLSALTFLCRLLVAQDILGVESEFYCSIESIYTSLWKGLDDLRPDLLERFIEVEGIIQ